MEYIDFNVITPCGERCTGCKKKEDGFCQGCNESDGNCREWHESGGCPIYKCARKHDVLFCGLCYEFPCSWLIEKVHWNQNIVEDLTMLAKTYKGQGDNKYRIFCQNCGEILKDDINIYDERLKKQNISISPILPRCKFCDAEILISNTARRCTIIVLNGTCGSGKTTIAEMLVSKGYLAIDGDCVIQTVRHKNKRKEYEWNELIEEIANQIDVLALFGSNIVISHVILPEDLDRYIEIFESRNLQYKFILLKPEYQTAVERCQKRTCHATVTPEQWIKHFYDLLEFDDRITVVDNTLLTAEETVEYILKKSSPLHILERR